LTSYPILTGDLRGNPRIPGATGTDRYSDGVIEEVNGDGTRAWIWSMKDHFSPASSPFPLNFESTPEFANTGWDVFHINAIDRQPDGDYVVTARHMDGAFRVDSRHAATCSWTLGNVLTMFDNQVGDVPGVRVRPRSAQRRNSYRTVNYPPSDFDVNDLRNNAGGSITPP
jgi:hypothetical protein